MVKPMNKIDGSYSFLVQSATYWSQIFEVSDKEFY